MYAGPNGLTFHCVQGLAKQSQCSVDLPKELFRQYFVGEEEVWLEESDDDSDQRTLRAKETIQGGEFGINLTTVLECFSILAKSHKVKLTNGSQHHGEYASLDSVPLCMSYDRNTATFHLEFLDEISGCLVTCEVPGVAVDESGDQSGLAGAFRSSPLLSRAILYSDALSAAVGELHDVPGASVVDVKLNTRGLEIGAIGPRSEVWVSVPYHSNQSLDGMYVGLECYSEQEDVVKRRYPLSAFLTGMRGLDIGCETCISVNSRGMMAIQHQVSREDTQSGVRPSFVDFIMTCMEDEVDDDDERQEMRCVTNNASLQEEVSVASQNLLSNESKRRRQASYIDDSCSHSSNNSIDVEVTFDDKIVTEHAAEHDTTKTITRPTATSCILGELELDNDMMSSNLRSVNKRRMSALADIRHKRRSMNKTVESDDEHAERPKTRASANHTGRKRSSSSRNVKTGSEPSNSDHEFTHSSHAKKIHTNMPEDTTDSSSHSKSEDSESEHEDSLDVTAEIRTSHHDTYRSSEGVTVNSDEEDGAEEPRMMYGDTKLEFTQDGYDSDESM